MQTQFDWTPEDMVKRDNNAHAYLRKKGILAGLPNFARLKTREAT